MEGIEIMKLQHNLFILRAFKWYMYGKWKYDVINPICNYRTQTCVAVIINHLNQCCNLIFPYSPYHS